MMKRIWNAACRQLGYQLRSADIWFVLIAIGMCLFIYMERVRKTTEGAAGIFAIFPVTMLEYYMFIRIMIGFLFLVTDLPVHMPDNDFRVLRMDRGTWYCVQWVYLFLAVSAYAVFVWLAEALFSLPHVAFTAGWGSAFADRDSLNNVTGMFADTRPIPGVPAIIVFLASMLLFIFVGMLLGGICLFCNMCFSNAGVSAFAGAIFILLYAIEGAGYIQPLGILSPLGVYQNFWELTPATFIAQLGYFSVLCILLYMAGQRILYKIDLKGKAGKA